jgi:mannan endo-1,4-beta-mannosidase
VKARYQATAAAVLLVLTAAAAGCASPANLAWSQEGSEQPASGLPANLVQPGKGVPVGVYEQGFPGRPALIGTFATATGVQPRLTQYYSAWGERFWTSFADASRASGAVAVVQLQPTNVKLSTIVSGNWDAYLRAYADAVRSYGHSVILSFGHEMNGTWYSWASGHEKPAEFVAAWRHVVSVFRQQGAANVSWLWTITAVSGPGGSGPWLGSWWPGDQWVSLVGIDGYYYHPSDTFSSVFEPVLEQVRSFTKTPVIISEVGIGPNSSRDSQISALFAGVKTDHIDAVIWFDSPQHDGIYHQDWQLEGHPAALSAFRAAATAS